MSARPLLLVLAGVFAGLAVVMTIGAAVTGTPLVFFAAFPLGVTAGLMWYQATGRLAARVTGGGRRRGPRTTVGGSARGRGRVAHGSVGVDGSAGVDGTRRAAGERAEAGADGTRTDAFWEEVEREARHRARRRARWRERRRAGGQRATGGPGGAGHGREQRGPGREQRDGRRDQRGHGWQTGDRAGPGSGPTPAEAYETLGLRPDASQAAIREAYREKARACHPDAEDGDAEAFKRVTAAYELLSE